MNEVTAVEDLQAEEKKLVEKKQKEALARKEACEKELEGLLKKFNCDLATFRQEINGQFQQMQIVVVPK